MENHKSHGVVSLCIRIKHGGVTIMRTARWISAMIGVCLAVEICNGEEATSNQGGADEQLVREEVRGIVLETMNAGRYTYVRVKGDSHELWAAAPRFQVRVDDNVIVPRGMPMKDFQSPSLGRTFDRVYFVSRIEVLG